jgi:NADH-quinone oxidoreductase subunit C/D
MQPLLDTLKTRFPEAVLSVHDDTVRGELSVRVDADHIVEIAMFLHDDPGMAFDHITDVCSADYPDDLERFEVIYHLLSLPHGTRLRIKTRLPEDNPTIASVSDIWKGANFMEREVYDLMGITFTGHPDLRRILMPEDYEEGYPLRKDFPAEGRGWRSRFDFIPNLTEPARDEGDGDISEEEKRPFLLENGAAARPSRRTEELLLNMGLSIRVLTASCGWYWNWMVSGLRKQHRTSGISIVAWRSCPKAWRTCRSSRTRIASTTSAR